MVSAVSEAIRVGAHMDPTAWVSHLSGRVTPIENMVDEHILAAIRMIEIGRDASGTLVPEWCKQKAPQLVLEASKRGILGQYKSSERVKDGWDA